MSTFDERLRERVNNLIAETMDDVASEMRKAVTPPAATDVLTDLPGGYRPVTSLGLPFCAARSLDGTVCTLNVHDDELHCNSRVGRVWKDSAQPGPAEALMIQLECDAQLSRRFLDYLRREIRRHGGLT